MTTCVRARDESVLDIDTDPWTIEDHQSAPPKSFLKLSNEGEIERSEANCDKRPAVLVSNSGGKGK